MVSEAMTAWLLSLMMTTLPPGRTLPRDAAESAEEGRIRYQEIAEAITAVALDPEEPKVFKDPARTAALMLAVSYYESSWRKDVDLGIGTFARGDGGASWCMMQIHLGRTPTATGIDGWTGPELVASRERCFRAGLHALRRSINACRSKPTLEWLNAYASGTCARGRVESSKRMGLAMRWYGMRPKPTILAER